VHESLALRPVTANKPLRYTKVLIFKEMEDLMYPLRLLS
jgi:hypothetical protein